MRSTLLAWPLGALLLLPATAGAQGRAKIHIDQVRVGFRGAGERTGPGAKSGLYKAGFWTPVYVDLSAGNETIEEGDVTVESTDPDEIPNNFRVPLPRMEPKEQATVLVYTKPGNVRGEIAVTVRANGQTVSSRENYDSLGLGDALYLSLGSALGGFKRTTLRENQRNADQQNERAEQYVGLITTVSELPDRWFGYAGVDLLVLATGERREEFLEPLLNEREGRKEALAEWVRRGGRLVVTAGSNHDMVAKLLSQMAMTERVAITGAVPDVTRLRAVETWAGPGNQDERKLENRPLKDGKVPPIPVAKLEVKPGKDVQRLLPARKDEEGPLLIVRFPHGLGQVTLVAFDVDKLPFSAWAGQADFWTQLRASVAPPVQARPDANPHMNQQPGDLAAQLQNNLETPPDVPVISFGWVALFIFIYILIVGPLDYFFLKKVVKRLELTWITFPTVVLVISAVAYFAAYSIKGNDQKISKVDVIDFDPSSGQVYGHSFFTIFSPRIQHYTIGVQPAAPWAATVPAVDQKFSPVLVSWMGRPDDSYGGTGRPRGQGLFRRAYDYAPDAAGLRGVPIQVWSLKSFASSWERPADPKEQPFTADLRYSEEGVDKLEGTLTCRLGESLKTPAAIDLRRAYLVYHSNSGSPRAVKLDAVKPGVAIKVPTENTVRILDLLQQGGVSAAPDPTKVKAGEYGRMAQQMSQSIDQKDSLVLRLLFADAMGQPSSLSFKQLDQSWRLSLKDQAILVARLDHAEGPAEEVNEGPASPSRLWLGALPGPGARPALAGKLTQDTFVRVFLPISYR